MQEILNFLAVWIIVVPFLAGIINFKVLDRDSVIIWAVIIMGIIPQLIHFFLPNSIAEKLAYNLYTPAEFFGYWLLFYPRVKTKSVVATFQFLMVLFIGMSIYFLLSNGIAGRFINEWVSLNNIIYLVWLGLFISEDFKYDWGSMESSKPIFWYSIGILAYAASTCIVYALWKPITQNPESVLSYMRTLQNFFNVLVYLLYSVGLFSWRKLKTAN